MALQMSGAPVWGEDAALQADRSTSCRQVCRPEISVLTGALFLYFLSQKVRGDSSACTVIRSGIPFRKRLFGLTFGRRLETKIKIYGNDLQIFGRNSQSNQWQRCSITVSLKMDGMSVASPIQDPAPGLGSRSGRCVLAFQAGAFYWE